MTDSNGRVVPVSSIESATMQLFGDATIYPAVVEKPNSPFYVVLLLDASGSMGGAMADMQAAAKASLQNAPPEARFAVVQRCTRAHWVEQKSEQRAAISTA